MWSLHGDFKWFMLTTIKVYECYAVKFHDKTPPKKFNMEGAPLLISYI